ncbi:MAG: acyl-CoA dehydrogenase family protein [Planctomycetes bacterium]|nr:acyl-CoA dehydrogenase family protein [Planctomycetota bacterium]
MSLDLYFIEDLLTEDERMVRDAVHQFVEERVLPVIAGHYEAGTFPRELIPEVAKLGVLGANLPEKYGCAGLNNVAYGLITQELEWGDSGLRSFCSVQGSLVMYPIHAFGSEEQRRKWLPKLAAAEKIGCFGLTEPDFGSNPDGMRTRAEKTSRGWVLDGTKMWITNGTMADVAVVWARTKDGIRGFLVEKGTPGFAAKIQKGKWSLRASDTSELHFDRCEIPEENLLPGTEGVKNALMCLTQARYGIAWGAIGAARFCFESALKYAKERVQFGKPIASFQLVQAKLAEMATQITLAQLACLRLGRLKDEGKMKHWQVSLAKRNNVAQALEIARVARDIHGANGIVYEYHVGRHMMNLETVKTYEGTHDIHTLILGSHLTGIAAFE